MKTILYVLVLMSLFSLAFRPGTPPPPPPPTEPPPVETQPPPVETQPPEVTEPPSTEPPEVTEPPGTEEPAPTERSKPNPEQVTPVPGGEKAEPRVIKLPAGGYGQPEHDLYYWLRWFLLVLIGFVGVWAAAWSLKR